MKALAWRVMKLKQLLANTDCSVRRYTSFDLDLLIFLQPSFMPNGRNASI